MAPSTNESYRTQGAAQYVTARGVTTSASLLQKLRLRGPDDPRDRGPDFYRDPRGICFYGRAALDQYVADRLAQLAFRSRVSQPESLRKATAA